jgi:arylformamidase
VFIHGGYWRAMDKADFRYVAEGLVPAGAMVAVVNYALVPSVDIDEIVRQNRAALAWLWHHAADYGGDPNRIFVSGHSAGGHLTAMMMATDWPGFDRALPKDLVKGGCAISGVFDLEPVRLCYLNDDMGMDEATAARNSPIWLLDRMTPAPLILCVGGIETDEFHRQQADFAAAWAAAWSAAPPPAGAPLTVVDAPGMHHFVVVDELAKAESPLNRAVRDQMSLP